MCVHLSAPSKMKSKILPTCLQRNYRDSLGEFGNRSYGVFGAERDRVEHSFYNYCVVIIHRDMSEEYQLWKSNFTWQVKNRVLQV